MPRTGLSAAELKAKAVEATVAAMRRDGFDKVKLTEIARELGVSHAALYMHFADKAELLDAVSAQWLRDVDAALEAICKKPGKTPIEKLHAWMLALHRAKRDKVRNDPELYRSFDMNANAKKPYVQEHMAAMRTQLVGLVREALPKRRARGDADASARAEQIAEILWESMMAFHHPKLVAQYVAEKREPLLKEVLDAVLQGVGLGP